MNTPGAVTSGFIWYIAEGPREEKGARVSLLEVAPTVMALRASDGLRRVS